MCLESIDKKIIPHESGYKIIKRKFYEGGFETAVMRKALRFRKWYSADEERPGVFPEDQAASGDVYTAGFHYFLKKSDAIFQVGFNEIVVKIKVKNVLHTGIDRKCPAGVSEKMMLSCIILDTKKHDIETAKIKNLKKVADKLTTSEMENFVLETGRKYKGGQIPETSVKRVVKTVIKDDNSFARWVVFIDSFDRNSSVFKFATKIHIIMCNKKESKYWAYYNRIASEDHELLDLVNKSEISKTMNGQFNLH